jgi:hypothetical protein
LLFVKNQAKGEQFKSSDHRNRNHDGNHRFTDESSFRFPYLPAL